MVKVFETIENYVLSNKKQKYIHNVFNNQNFSMVKIFVTKMYHVLFNYIYFLFLIVYSF